MSSAPDMVCPNGRRKRPRKLGPEHLAGAFAMSGPAHLDPRWTAIPARGHTSPRPTFHGLRIEGRQAACSRPRRACLGWGWGMRVCGTPGCGTLIPKGARGGRCQVHERQTDRARGSATARGYGADHRALRADYQRRMDAGKTFDCWRCERVIDPRSWQLGHCDDDHSKYHGPEHVGCNTATSGRTGCENPSHANISPRA